MSEPNLDFYKTLPLVSQHTAKRRIIYQQSYANLTFHNYLTSLGSHPQTEIDQSIKNGNTCTVWSTVINQRRFVIKRYNIKSFWHGIGRALRQTRAANSWKRALMLQLLEIPTPKPAALVECRIGPIRRTAYFISEYVHGENCRDWFKHPDRNDQDLQTMAANVCKLIQCLQQHHISHGDMKATNLIISAAGPVIIDLDAMHVHADAKSFTKSHQTDIIRFLNNWQDNEKLYGYFQNHLKGVQP